MRKQAFIAPLLCLLMLAGLASVGSSSPAQPACITAKVSLTGTIQLGWYNWTSKTFETYNVSITETNLTASVPPEITPGQYINATFEGYARVDQTSVEFFGTIHVNATSPGFMISFTVPNTWPQVPIGTIEACGTVETTITKTTVPSLQYTMVHLVGPVTKYGSENATGWISADGMITNVTQLAKVHVFWMPTPKIAPGPTPKSTNFTYSFYHASLINASIVAVNYIGYDFYVYGWWTVYNVTFTYYGQQFCQYKESATVVAQNVTGNLAVSSLNFTVSIAGFNEVKGSIWRLDIYHRIIPEWNLEGDVTGPNGLPQGKVDIYDLVAIARRIGDTPGCGQGSFNLQEVEQYDVNFDCQINIYTLVTIASEIGS
jgi:hypothetical protein